MKKLFTILLVCTFAFSTMTFVGCGGDDAGSGAATDGATDGGGDDTEDDATDEE